MMGDAERLMDGWLGTCGGPSLNRFKDMHITVFDFFTDPDLREEVLACFMMDKAMVVCGTTGRILASIEKGDKRAGAKLQAASAIAQEGFIAIECSEDICTPGGDMWGVMQVFPGTEGYVGVPNFAAEEAYSYAIEADPGCPSLGRAHNTLGTLLLTKRKDVDAAEEAFRAAIEVNPGLAESHNNLGCLLLSKRGDVDAAEEAFRAAIEADFSGDRGDSHNSLGWLLYTKRGDVDGAEEAYREAIIWSGGDWTARMNLVLLLLVSRGRIFEGLHHCHEANGTKGTLALVVIILLCSPYFVLFFLYHAVTTVFSEVLRLSVQLRVVGGDPNGKFKGNRCSRNASSVTPVVEGGFGHFDFEAARAEAEEGEGEFVGLSPYPLERAVAIDPSNAAAHNNLGLQLQTTQKDMGAAEEAYRAAIEADPGFAPAHRNLGLLLQTTQKDVGAAEEAYRAAIEADPGDAIAHCALGCLLQTERKDVHGAEKAYRAAIEADPGLRSAHYNLGTLLEAKGDVDGAEEAYRAAIELPGLPRAASK